MCDCPTRSSRYVSEVFLIGDRRHLVNNAVNVVFKRRTQELDLFEMGDKSFERIECSEKWVCNEAQTAQFGDEFTLVRRSEEHTSELQSLMRISYAVFCLKQKTQKR